MSYVRVIPRDLFNEGNLLKCYGKLVIELETAGPHSAVLDEGDGEPFDIQQDEDGGLTIVNLPFTVRGEPWTLRRPLNSREPWPLYAVPAEGDPVPVLSDDGKLTWEFLQVIRHG